MDTAVQVSHHGTEHDESSKAVVEAAMDDRPLVHVVRQLQNDEYVTHDFFSLGALRSLAANPGWHSRQSGPAPWMRFFVQPTGGPSSWRATAPQTQQFQRRITDLQRGK
jgi:hypothetical protein